MFGQKPELLQWAQQFKGLFFILSTALLLYFLVERLYGRIEREKEDLETLYRNPDLGLLKLDYSGRIRFISPRLEERLGFTARSLRKEFLQNLAAPEGQEAVKKLLSHNPDTPVQEGLNLEIPLLDHKGSPWWYHFQCNFPHHGQSHNAIVASLHNVTPHHEYRRKLATELGEKNALINASSDAIWSYDRSLKLLSANTSFYQSYQRLTNGTIKPGEQLLHRTQNESLNRYWRLLYRKPLNGFSVEKVMQDEHRQTYSIRLFPLSDEKGQIQGGVCYAHNISERLRYLDRLEKQNKRLRQISWMQSHLVRAPLARILGLVRLIPLEEKNLSPEHRDLLEKIDLSSQELDQVIHNISANTNLDPLEQEQKP
jgi:PAS domain S-box-containing protein